MGLASSLLGHGRTDDPDPVTGLTSRDRYLISSTWATLKKTPIESGAAVLLAFFEKYPEYVNLFQFRDVPRDQLKQNRKFQAHCKSLIHAIDNIVDPSNENELLVEILKKVGQNHVGRNIPEKSFEELKEVMLDLFSTLMKPNEVEAWRKVLTVGFKVVVDGFKEAEKA